MVNPPQITGHFDNDENTSIINSGNHLDFSIHTLWINNGTPANLILHITYTSHLDNSIATTVFNIRDYFSGNGTPLVDNSNNPIYIRTVINSDITLVLSSVIANDKFDVNFNYMFT